MCLMVQKLALRNVPAIQLNDWEYTSTEHTFVQYYPVCLDPFFLPLCLSLIYWLRIDLNVYSNEQIRILAFNSIAKTSLKI